MSRRAGTVFEAVGDANYAGYDVGGARIYPIGSLTSPVAYGQTSVGPADSLPTTPPMGDGSTGGSTLGAVSAGVREAVAKPFGAASPLPWVIVGLVGAVVATHVIHYRKL